MTTFRCFLTWPSGNVVAFVSYGVGVRLSVVPCFFSLCEVEFFSIKTEFSARVCRLSCLIADFFCAVSNFDLSTFMVIFVSAP